LRTGRDGADFIGQTLKGKKFEFEVDDEMAEVVQTYLDYVRAKKADSLRVEQRFSLASLKPPFDAGGTADAVIYDATTKNLEVVDLKTGRGVRVKADENKQLRTYALGAMLENTGLPVMSVTSTIVQPRTSSKPSSETFHVADLVEWTGDLLDRMRVSFEARTEYGRVKAGELTMAQWAAKWLRAGDHCGKTFCKAAGFCPALQQKAYDAASVWFDDQDKPRLANSPDSMSPEAIAQALDAADMISDWINAVRSYAHAQAEGGADIPGYILVPKEGREKFVDDEAARKAGALAIKAGLPEDKVFNPAKVKTPKQLRDAITKAKLKMPDGLAGLSAKPDKGTNLVRADKTTREAVASKASKFLETHD
jgi:hypothetical protein